MPLACIWSSAKILQLTHFGAREGAWEGSSCQAVPRASSGELLVSANSSLPNSTRGCGEPLGTHQSPNGGRGLVSCTPCPSWAPKLGHGWSPNVGTPCQGGRSQVKGLVSCLCFMLTGKLLLLRFHGRDESAAGVSRDASSQRSRALSGCQGHVSILLFFYFIRYSCISPCKSSQGQRGAASCQAECSA